MIKVDNAIIMAAGMSSRFLPLTINKPKALLEVKGEILIERLIRQLKDAGIAEIIVVGGYYFESLKYLEKEFGIVLIENKDYYYRNNHSSIFAAKKYLKNSYICSSDNYYVDNVFKSIENEAYYSCIYTDEYTNEWIVTTDENGIIRKVQIGKENGYYMLGHAFFDEKFSDFLLKKIEENYNNELIYPMFWEDIYIQNISEMNLKMVDLTDKIYEFDNLEELRGFDISYIKDTRCEILRKIARENGIDEDQIQNIKPIKKSNQYVGFSYSINQISKEYYF